MADPWTCAVCGARYPVQSMARLCESTHDNQEPQ